MKKITIIGLILLTTILIGCNKNEGFVGWYNAINHDGLIKDHRVITIDNCQYIMYDAGSGYSGNGFLAHKGNCNNPIHIYNKISDGK